MSLASILKILGGIYAVKDGLSGLSAALNGVEKSEQLASPSPTKLSVPRDPWSTLTSTTDFVGDIDGRVRHLIRLVRKGKRSPKIQLAVARILNRKCGDKWCIPEKDHKKEILALFKWCRSQMRYLADPRGVDTYRAPERSLFEFHGGDCDDMSSAIATLLAIALETAGYEVRFRVVAIKPNPPTAYSHILVLVGLPQRKPEKWMALDASVDKPAGWYPATRISGFKDFIIPA